MSQVVEIEKPDVLAGVMPLAVDTRGLARLLSVSRDTIIQWDRMHRIPEAKIAQNRCKRWSTDEIRAWVLSGCPDRQKWNAMRDMRIIGTMKP